MAARVAAPRAPARPERRRKAAGGARGHARRPAAGHPPGRADARHGLRDEGAADRQPAASLPRGLRRHPGQPRRRARRELRAAGRAAGGGARGGGRAGARGADGVGDLQHPGQQAVRRALPDGRRRARAENRRTPMRRQDSAARSRAWRSVAALLGAAARCLVDGRAAALPPTGRTARASSSTFGDGPQRERLRRVRRAGDQRRGAAATRRLAGRRVERRRAAARSA